MVILSEAHARPVEGLDSDQDWQSAQMPQAGGSVPGWPLESMHVRGKAMLMEATHPDGTQRSSATSTTSTGIGARPPAARTISGRFRDASHVMREPRIVSLLDGDSNGVHFDLN